MSQMEKELNAFKEKDTLAEMSKTARKMLSEDEINIPDELLAHWSARMQRIRSRQSRHLRSCSRMLYRMLLKIS